MKVKMLPFLIFAGEYVNKTIGTASAKCYAINLGGRFDALAIVLRSTIGLFHTFELAFPTTAFSMAAKNPTIPSLAEASATRIPRR